MGDDGMLLNFELPSDAFTPKQSFKGGTWKDRLKAKKSAAGGGRRRADGRPSKTIPRFEEVRSDEEELIIPGEQPNKRLKTGAIASSRNIDMQQGARSGARSGGSHQPPLKPFTGEVISSLFTYNPKSTAAQDEVPEVDDAPIEPSNAPLVDELATFTNLGLSPILASHLLKKLEISAPTAIQSKAIEQLCRSDTDAFIQAETGSGKTLAYLLPVLERITQMSKKMKAADQSFTRESGLFSIILAPTRELAKQIEVVLEGLLSCCPWIVGGIVIGGEKKKSEKARLRKGVNILVATPGRLADHLEHTEVLDVSRVRWLVLDEGDRLMELGFEQDIQRIVGILNLRGRKPQDQPIPGLPERRTTVLCSATIKSDVEQLKTIALKDAVSITADPRQTADSEGPIAQSGFSAPAQLKQSYVLVPPKQRLVTLVAILKQTFRRKGSVMKCIVFISCADSVDFHFDVLTHGNAEDAAHSAENINDSAAGETLQPTRPPRDRSDKIPQGNTIAESRTHAQGAAFSAKQNPVQVFRLHGSLQQATRTGTLKAFTKCADPSVLVCTDVAARGLDLPNIDLVVEYDPPFSKEDHLHRIGRTARAGKDGRAMIFLMPGCEEGYVDVLKEGRPRQLTKHGADDLLKKGFSATTGVVGDQNWEDAATAWQLDVERWAVDHPKHLEQARRAYQSHVRAYATHVAAERKIFDMQQLHLGHLAKAFALRDRPGSLRVPGLRPGKDASAKSKEIRRGKAASSQHHRGEGDSESHTATADAESRKRMHAKMNALGAGGASEFNLG